MDDKDRTEINEILHNEFQNFNDLLDNEQLDFNFKENNEQNSPDLFDETSSNISSVNYNCKKNFMIKNISLKRSSENLTVSSKIPRKDKNAALLERFSAISDDFDDLGFDPHPSFIGNTQKNSIYSANCEVNSTQKTVPSTAQSNLLDLFKANCSNPIIEVPSKSNVTTHLYSNLTLSNKSSVINTKSNSSIDFCNPKEFLKNIDKKLPFNIRGVIHEDKENSCSLTLDLKEKKSSSCNINSSYCHVPNVNSPIPNGVSSVDSEYRQAILCNSKIEPQSKYGQDILPLKKQCLPRSHGSVPEAPHRPLNGQPHSPSPHERQPCATTVVAAPQSRVTSSTHRHSSSVCLNNMKPKFPGPAGLLPNLHADRPSVAIETELLSSLREAADKTLPPAAAPGGRATLGPLWQYMMQDLSIDPADEASPLTRFNLQRSVLQCGGAGGGALRRIPLLSVQINSITSGHNQAIMLLSDHTGEVTGLLSSSGVDAYLPHLSCGCVLLLTHCTVWRPSPARPPVLTVTADNVAAVYAPLLALPSAAEVQRTEGNAGGQRHKTGGSPSSSVVNLITTKNGNSEFEVKITSGLSIEERQQLKNQLRYDSILERNFVEENSEYRLDSTRPLNSNETNSSTPGNTSNRSNFAPTFNQYNQNQSVQRNFTAPRNNNQPVTAEQNLRSCNGNNRYNPNPMVKPGPSNRIVHATPTQNNYQRSKDCLNKITHHPSSSSSSNNNNNLNEVLNKVHNQPNLNSVVPNIETIFRLPSTPMRINRGSCRTNVSLNSNLAFSPILPNSSSRQSSSVIPQPKLSSNQGQLSNTGQLQNRYLTQSSASVVNLPSGAPTNVHSTPLRQSDPIVKPPPKRFNFQAHCSSRAANAPGIGQSSLYNKSSFTSKDLITGAVQNSTINCLPVTQQNNAHLRTVNINRNDSNCKSAPTAKEMQEIQQLMNDFPDMMDYF